MIIVLTKKDLLHSAAEKDIDAIDMSDMAVAHDIVVRADLVIYVSDLVAKTLKDRTAEPRVLSSLDVMELIEKQVKADYDFAAWKD